MDRIVVAYAEPYLSGQNSVNTDGHCQPCYLQEDVKRCQIDTSPPLVLSPIILAVQPLPWICQFN